MKTKDCRMLPLFHYAKNLYINCINIHFGVRNERTTNQTQDNKKSYQR